MGRRDRSCYIPYWVGVCMLHWISAGLVLRFMKKDGITAGDIGYNLGKKGTLVLAASAHPFRTGHILLQRRWPRPGNRSRPDLCRCSIPL
ncbi:MAG: hypothetical protein LUE10_03345 [Alistipes sp.]|nr:hypothetical protein [Alistipes sp.]